MELRINYDEFSNNYEKYEHVKSNLIVKPQNVYNNKHKYSITIPTYKRPKMLWEAIESCIKQTYSKDDWQIIIVDNNPEIEPETETLINNLRSIPNIFYYKNEQNIGMFGNWNRCIELADGEYMTILSDDDLLKPDFLNVMDSMINKKPDINMIYSSYNYIKNGIIINTESTKWYAKLINKLAYNRIRKLTLLDFFLKTFGFSASGLIFKRSLAIKLGGHDDSIFPSSDYYFQSKYLENFGEAFLTNKNLCTYRIEDNESAKYEVCELLADMHLKIRNEMLNYIHLPKKILYDISIKNYHKDIYNIKRVWKHDLSYKLNNNNNNTNITNEVKNKIKTVCLYIIESVLFKVKKIPLYRI